MFATHPRVNSSAHTVFPAEACETPSTTAELITLPPSAIPTLGRHDNTPARIAITRPSLRAFERVVLVSLPEGALREPPTETNMIPKITGPCQQATPIPLSQCLRKRPAANQRTQTGDEAMMMGYPRAMPSRSIPNPTEPLHANQIQKAPAPRGPAPGMRYTRQKYWERKQA